MHAMANNWVIGDIHGCLKTFEQLLDKLSLTRTDSLFLLGDCINKGPDSKGVMDAIFRLQRQNYRVITLMGNHEEMLLNAQTDGREATRLMQNGGEKLLQSFGVKSLTHIPPVYLNWLRALPSFFISNQFVLVHAGLNFQTSDPFVDEKAMRWIRNFIVYPEKIGYRLLVHGHTPVALEVPLSQLQQKPVTIVNLDGGCVYAKRAHQGNLLALELKSRTLVVQKNVEAIE
jgi:serine/threonine protein phosphatase 1